MRTKQILLPVLLSVIVLISGCATVGEINSGFRKIDRMWALEYQKTEDLYRYRVIDAPYDIVYSQVKMTFLDLSMPLIVRDYNKGILIAENEAPKPLTQEEWIKVKKEESPKTKAEAGWLFYLPDDPSGYIVTVKAKLLDKGDKTLVLLDYRMKNPEHEEMGFEPSEYAPPLAVQLGSIKFWNALKQRLTSVSLPAPRKRAKSERYALNGGQDSVSSVASLMNY